MLVVRRHEDDLGRSGELAQHPPEVEAVHAGHLDVAEHDVDAVLGQGPQGLGAAAGQVDVADPVVAVQQEGQLGARMGLVVDDERAQRGAVTGGCGHGRSVRRDGRGSAGRNRSASGARAALQLPLGGVDARGVLRHPEADLGAGADGRLDDQTVVVAVDLAQPGVDVGQAHRLGLGRRRRAPGGRPRDRTRSRCPPPRSRLDALVGGGDRDLARAGHPLQAVAHGVLDQGLDGEVGHRDRQHLGRDQQRDDEPVAEPGLLEDEVALDVAQLGGQRGELAARPERIAGEVGELQQQLAGPLGVGPDERRDGGQEL